MASLENQLPKLQWWTVPQAMGSILVLLTSEGMQPLEPEEKEATRTSLAAQRSLQEQKIR